MNKYKFKKIDAFAKGLSSGNPAGYILLNSSDDINEIEMLNIAKELKGFVNEVGYVFRSSEKSFDMKYFSSEKEVDFCGHATIAIMYDLLVNNADLQQYDMLEINTNRGILSVENRIKSEDAVFIMSPEPIYKECKLAIKELAKHLTIDFKEIDTNYEIALINAGLTTLLVPINNLESILRISPDLNDLNNFCKKSNIDIIEVFTNETSNSENHYRARVFAPTFGYIEDPATGSGNSAFGYYMIKHGLWKNKTMVIEQNGSKDNFNIVKLQKKTDTKGNERVLFGGNATLKIVGEYIAY